MELRLLFELQQLFALATLDRLKSFSARRLGILSQLRCNRLFAALIWPLRKHLKFLEEISGWRRRRRRQS